MNFGLKHLQEPCCNDLSVFCFFVSVTVSVSFLFGLILIKATTKTSQTNIGVMESDYTSTLPCIGQW